MSGFTGSSKAADGASQVTYCVNWKELLQASQNSFAESVIENTSGFGIYHVRVLRILRKKKFLSEYDIKGNCLLPPKDVRAIINKLMSAGYLKHI